MAEAKQGAGSVQFAVYGCADVDKWGSVCVEGAPSKLGPGWAGMHFVQCSF
ncbi:hypothetical protein SBA5_80086 [Candidatus Sulfotelmatomonas gaucii]|uniref:Uncharacterized protein n=1 Tax=Candidatus Sulfuritelmatomonas gaucii TaxID=2043161 RepID=A0A2N9M5M4_9BACT|nr:hypothetical protein SBA5_80086 [Candidatus Sulfotelmatomonas gaucii]